MQETHSLLINAIIIIIIIINIGLSLHNLVPRSPTAKGKVKQSEIWDHYIVQEMVRSIGWLSVTCNRKLRAICSVLNIIKCPALFSESFLIPARFFAANFPFNMAFPTVSTTFQIPSKLFPVHQLLLGWLELIDSSKFVWSRILSYRSCLFPCSLL